MDLQRISDQLEITALRTKYARAVDTKDWDLYRSSRPQLLADVLRTHLGPDGVKTLPTAG